MRIHCSDNTVTFWHSIIKAVFISRLPDVTKVSTILYIFVFQYRLIIYIFFSVYVLLVYLQCKYCVPLTQLVKFLNLCNS